MKSLIKDNVLGVIKFADEFYDLSKLIDTKEFKKLYNINQIAFLDRYISTATISRFSHSLGVFEIARRIITKPDFDHIDLTTKKETLAAALLHDIGHGPFSHSFELFFDKSIFNHEKMTQKIILDPDSEINQVLKTINLSPENVANIIAKKPTSKVFQFQIDLISSQIDCDRVDYFLRDANACGFSYGRFDLHLFIEYIHLDENNNLYFDYHLTSLITSFLKGRYESYKFIYRNKEGQTHNFIIKTIIKTILNDKTIVTKNFANNYILNLLDKINQKIELTANEFYFLDDCTLTSFLKALFLNLNKNHLQYNNMLFLLNNLFGKNNFKYLTKENITKDYEIVAKDLIFKKEIYNNKKQPIFIKINNEIKELSTIFEFASEPKDEMFFICLKKEKNET